MTRCGCYTHQVIRFRGKGEVTDEAESALAINKRARLDLGWLGLSQDGAGHEQPGRGTYVAWEVTGKLCSVKVLNARPRILVVILGV